ncbi:MAG: hypothetical protein ACI9DJ_000947 [Algoriphagus sp.]|jgi:hypothetical protein
MYNISELPLLKPKLTFPNQPLSCLVKTKGEASFAIIEKEFQTSTFRKNE